jgi:hypothetical protein
VQKALKSVLPTSNYYLLNLLTDTPWLLYQFYSLFNQQNTLIDKGDTVGGQTVILILAFNAVCCSHVSNSDFVFFNRNGPVPIDGYAILTSLGSAMGKKICWIGDEARHVWGNSDNPILVGIMPTISNKLFNPPTLANRLNYYDPNVPGNCGAPTINKVIQDAINEASSQEPNIQLSTSLSNKITLGNLLNTAFSPGNSDGITWSDCLTKTAQVYAKIKNIINSNPNLLSSLDVSYLKSNSTIYKSVNSINSSSTYDRPSILYSPTPTSVRHNSTSIIPFINKAVVAFQQLKNV